MLPACICAPVLEHSTGNDYGSIVGIGIGALALGLYLFGCCSYLLQRYTAHRFARKTQHIREASRRARRHMDRTSEEFVNQVQQQGNK